MVKVFLGGTCNNSKWREYVKSHLLIDYYDPVVSQWNEESYQRELEERRNCDYCLYVITPKMTGVYSIAEVVDDSNKRPNKTLFCILEKDGNEIFSDFQLKSLRAVGEMIKKNGSRWLKSLDALIEFLNAHQGLE